MGRWKDLRGVGEWENMIKTYCMKKLLTKKKNKKELFKWVNVGMRWKRKGLTYQLSQTLKDTKLIRQMSNLGSN